jgi:hypothetical protein
MRVLVFACAVCLLALVMILSTGTRLAAHGGGIDSRGCHNDNKPVTTTAIRTARAGQTFPSANAAVAAGCKHK